MIKFYSSNDDYMVSREGAKSIISVSTVERIDVKAIPYLSQSQAAELIRMIWMFRWLRAAGFQLTSRQMCAPPDILQSG